MNLLIPVGNEFVTAARMFWDRTKGIYKSIKYKMKIKVEKYRQYSWM